MLFPQVIDMQPLRLFYFGKMVKVLHFFFSKKRRQLNFLSYGQSGELLRVARLAK